MFDVFGFGVGVLAAELDCVYWVVLGLGGSCKCGLLLPLLLLRVA